MSSKAGGYTVLESSGSYHPANPDITRRRAAASPASVQDRLPVLAVQAVALDPAGVGAAAMPRAPRTASAGSARRMKAGSLIVVSCGILSDRLLACGKRQAD